MEGFLFEHQVYVDNDMQWGTALKNMNLVAAAASAVTIFPLFGSQTVSKDGSNVCGAVRSYLGQNKGDQLLLQCRSNWLEEIYLLEAAECWSQPRPSVTLYP